MSEKQAEVPERIRLAEEWRVAGKKLRERSPLLFQKLIEMFAVVTRKRDDEQGDRISDQR